jgi:hypothetical protein
LDPEELLDDEVDVDDGGVDEDEDDADADEDDESGEDAEDFVAPESWVLDLASEEAVLAAGFSASIAFFLDSEG